MRGHLELDGFISERYMVTASVKKKPSFDKYIQDSSLIQQTTIANTNQKINQDSDITAMDVKELPELEGEKEFIIADKPTEADTEAEDETQVLLTHSPVNFWLNLPDVAFNVLMMMHNTTQLRILTQVSSSLKKRITVNILENPATKKILRARMERAMGPGIFPSNEEITNAMWLSN